MTHLRNRRSSRRSCSSVASTRWDYCWRWRAAADYSAGRCRERSLGRTTWWCPRLAGSPPTRRRANSPTRLTPASRFRCDRRPPRHRCRCSGSGRACGVGCVQDREMSPGGSILPLPLGIRTAGPPPPMPRRYIGGSTPTAAAITDHTFIFSAS